ncbi:MAG: universal stress protein [Actinomycetales bacterium]|mgnify:CR=1 FL=1|nr:universal stress protein [Tetrasphaera sp.]NLW99524.1 universal stress protein [Actinomycetales bacterium]
MTVAVAYAGGESSKAALRIAVEEARRRRMTLVVINATLGSDYESPRFTGPESIRDLENRLRGSGVNYVIRQPVSTDVAEGVLDEAERVRASLLVVGLRRRSAVGKAILGSIAAQIVLDARVPVLAIPPAMVEGD